MLDPLTLPPAVDTLKDYLMPTPFTVVTNRASSRLTVGIRRNKMTAELYAGLFDNARALGLKVGPPRCIMGQVHFYVSWA